MSSNRKALLTLLDDFFIWVYTDRIRDIFGKHKLDQIREQERLVRTRLDKEFKLLVMGEFKRGKSTLVNALLGTPLVTMSITPETMTINEIGYGDQLHIEAVTIDNRRFILDLDDIASEKLQVKMSAVKKADSAEVVPPSALTPDKLHQLETALLDAFDLDDLRLMIRRTRGHNLDEISLGKNLEIVVSDIVMRAKKRGWLTQLVEKAAAEAPTNPNLSAIVAWYEATIKPQENDLIDDIPTNLYHRLSRSLLANDAFATQDALTSLFNHPSLILWQAGLPAADSPQQRVKATISYLHNQFTVDNHNALVMLLECLAEGTPEQKETLSTLALKLAEAEHYIYTVRRQNIRSNNGYLQESAQSQALHSLPEGIENINHLRILAPISLLQGVKLVDTPGTQDLANRFDELVKNYIHQADAVIFVIMSTSPLSLTERDLLKMGLARRDFSKILFVLNQMDLHDGKNAQKVLAHVEQQTLQMFPQAQLFGVSAYDELCRLEGIERPNPARAKELERDFKRLRDTIKNSLLLNRESIQLERAVSETTVLLNEIEAYATELERGVTLKHERLDAIIAQCTTPDSDLFQRIDALREKTAVQLQTMKTTLIGWLDELVTRFQEETIPSLGHVSYTEIQRHFLFFVIDKLTAALQNCFDAQQPEIATLIQEADTAVMDELKRLQEAVQIEADFSTETHQAWVYLDAYDSLTKEGIATVYTLVDRFLLVVKRMMNSKSSLSGSRRRRNYQNNLLEALPDFRRALHDEVERLYAQIVETVDVQIRDKAAALFQDFGAAMQRAAELQGKNAENIVELQETLQQLHQHTTETRIALLELQKPVQPELVGG
ncbi:MAG: hypothetical protein DHS20C20_06370 [Ardenticatenaceae bacterium]|nr:MAG: hypothetical protein DHS20C20_06370 [Ardenticatenaceae bacterium]